MQMPDQCSLEVQLAVNFIYRDMFRRGIYHVPRELKRQAVSHLLGNHFSLRWALKAVAKAARLL